MPAMTIDAKGLLAIRSQILERNDVLSRAAAPQTAAKPDFGAVMQGAMQAVNTQQTRAAEASAA